MKCRCDMEGPGKRRILIKDINEKVIINFPVNFLQNRNFFSVDSLDVLYCNSFRLLAFHITHAVSLYIMCARSSVYTAQHDA